ncbi:MAG: PqqD family protein [bacterium]|nr:PqqD family protein [bacterium]
MLNQYNSFKDICFLKREAPEVFFRSQTNEDGTLYILENSIDKEAFTINETNVSVWDLLDGETSVAKIINVLYERFGDSTEKEKILADVLVFLDFLWERNFIFKAFHALDRREIEQLDCYG